VFELADPSPLPLHTENPIKLRGAGWKGNDLHANSVGCDFDSPHSTIEDGSGRWGHILKGRRHNAIGRPDEPIVDKNNKLARTHSCFGGQHYEVKYNVQVTKAKQYAALTVSVLDPGRGRSRFSTV
jgi:hypothetical protein